MILKHYEICKTMREISKKIHGKPKIELIWAMNKEFGVQRDSLDHRSPPFWSIIENNRTTYTFTLRDGCVIHIRDMIKRETLFVYAFNSLI